MNSKLFPLAGILLLALLLLGCTSTGQTSLITAEKQVATIKAIDSEGKEIVNRTISIEKGKNALEAFRQVAGVEAKTYVGMGSLVTSINGITPDSEHYWGLYINGEFADKSIDAYTIDKDITIEMKMEKIDFSKMGG
ncbi:MAG: DUF4430 domain-containing protein [Candidatus ainarchaeum sp.]|nr:DUF4430 domain-containing protein [Candidatus ainarchaeum sp.]